MRKLTLFLLPLAALLATSGAWAEDAQSILDKARAKQLERWEGIDNYVVEQTVAGTDIAVLYERVNETSFRVVPRSQWAAGMPGATSAEQAAAMAGTEDEGMIVDFDEIQELAGNAKLLGTERVDGRSAWHLKSDDVQHAEQMDDQEIAFETFEIWIDQGEYVPLKMVIHGQATADGQSRPIVMEKLDSDYRQVPGSNLYQAYRQVMTMQGVLDPEQQKQVEEARRQMAEMEKEMADMPDAQREMMERMIGPQIEMLRKMAAGEGVEVITEVTAVRVNVGTE